MIHLKAGLSVIGVLGLCAASYVFPFIPVVIMVGAILAGMYLVAYVLWDNIP